MALISADQQQRRVEAAESLYDSRVAAFADLERETTRLITQVSGEEVRTIAERFVTGVLNLSDVVSQLTVDYPDDHALIAKATRELSRSRIAEKAAEVAAIDAEIGNLVSLEPRGLEGLSSLEMSDMPIQPN